MTHGGDIYRNLVRTDYSVNVNPLGIPVRVKQAIRRTVRHCAQYPDIQAEELRREIGRKHGIQTENILCGNGASELFLAIFHAVKPKKTGIPIPSFGGYEYAAKAAGSEPVYLPMQEKDRFVFHRGIMQDADSEMDMLIFANPNNPTGNLLERKVVQSILEECLHRKIIVVADECFMEFTGKEESCSLKGMLREYPNLILVRAFTKTYAIPGVRLGYLMCSSRELLDRISRQLPEWNISSLAQAAGKAALQESKYIEKTIRLLKEERAYLTEQLTREGIRVFHSETNFLLLYTEIPLYEEMLRKKILIRDCKGFVGLGEGYFRIAVKKHRENQRLVQVIKQIRNKYGKRELRHEEN